MARSSGPTIEGMPSFHASIAFGWGPQTGASGSAQRAQDRVDQDEGQQDEDEEAGEDDAGQCLRRRSPRRSCGGRDRRPGSRRGAVSGVCGTKGQKARRPKIVSSAGSRVSIESAAQATPIAAIGPRPEVPLTLAIIRQSRAAITVSGRGEDRRAGRFQRRPHRLVLVGGVVQLLAVAGDQQQRVVGPGAQHQHRHDRARLAVDRDPELGQPVADRAREHLREQHRRQRDEEEHRRAVDHDQEEDHQADRGQQQGAVDAFEDFDRVGGEAGAAGDLHLEAAAGVGDLFAPELDRVEDPFALAVALDVGGDDRRLAVLGADRADEGFVAAGLAGDGAESGCRSRARPTASLLRLRRSPGCPGACRRRPRWRRRGQPRGSASRSSSRRLRRSCAGRRR